MFFSETRLSLYRRCTLLWTPFADRKVQEASHQRSVCPEVTLSRSKNGSQGHGGTEFTSDPYGEQSNVHLTSRVFDMRVAHEQAPAHATEKTGQTGRRALLTGLANYQCRSRCARRHPTTSISSATHVTSSMSSCQDMAKRSEASAMLFENTVRTEKACKWWATQDEKVMMTRWLNISKIVRRVADETTSSLVSAGT